MQNACTLWGALSTLTCALKLAFSDFPKSVPCSSRKLRCFGSQKHGQIYSAIKGQKNATFLTEFRRGETHFAWTCGQKMAASRAHQNGSKTHSVSGEWCSKGARSAQKMTLLRARHKVLCASQNGTRSLSDCGSERVECSNALHLIPRLKRGVC